MANREGWSMHQLDVKSAFLNGFLEEDVYVLQPQGFKKEKHEHKVYKLKKALYGLKQAPRAWNKRIDEFLCQVEFLKCVSEFGVYIKTVIHNKLEEKLIICLYMDDLLVTGSSEELINEFKSQMLSEFEMSDLERLSYFLGIEFVQTKSGIVMHQTKYASDLLKRFNMLQSNPAGTPSAVGLHLEQNAAEEPVDPAVYRKMVGSLRYLCHTRPDLNHSVGLISRFMQEPKQSHMTAAKRILRYLRGTTEFGILFSRNTNHEDMKLIGFSDSDWCGDKGDRKSTAGYIFFIEGAPISWSSKKEPVVALSSSEAEYIAAAEAACQAAWLEKLMNELKIKLKSKTTLMVDNKSAIDLAKNPICHGKSKHIKTRFHFLRDQVNQGKLNVDFCKLEFQLADIFTKALKYERFKCLRESIGVVCMKMFLA
ncbi:uncharacterized protein LOC113854179 [Abrus precatorius]|uniref:Uncharacterized protein LOC113854179 n=1 Tax=Abrus precatorius TaxID=3816 RepID=A0A8B8KAS6_ABRPR|nr:uncharacterized protein LOC113854179 [Abrus precatorius]